MDHIVPLCPLSTEVGGGTGGMHTGRSGDVAIRDPGLTVVQPLLLVVVVVGVVEV